MHKRKHLIGLLLATTLTSCLFLSNENKVFASHKPNGTVLSSIAGNSTDYFHDFKETSDGGYIGVGTTESTNIGVTNYGGLDGLIIKYDSDFNILWKKTWGGSDDDDFYNVIETTDGGFVAMGYFDSKDAPVPDKGGTGGANDLFVVKYDSNGTLLWQKSFGSIETEYGGDIAQLKDGNLIVVGYTDGSFEGNTHNGGHDFFLLKLSSTNGSTQWVKTLGSSSTDGLYGVTATSDGGFIVSGQTGTTEFGASDSYDGYFAKFDASGTRLWQSIYHEPTEYRLGQENFTQVEELPNGDIVVVGHVYQNNWLPYIAVHTSSGQIKWEDIIETGQEYGDEFTKIHIENNKIYVFGELTSDTIEGDDTVYNGSGKVIVAVYDFDGNRELLKVYEYKDRVLGAQGITLDDDGDIVVSILGWVDLPPQHIHGGGTDNLIMSLTPFANSGVDIELQNPNMNWTNQNITLELIINNPNGGLSHVILPDGNTTTQERFDYIITQNGKYTFIAVDINGIEHKLEVDVQTIDKSKPTMNLNVSYPPSELYGDITYTTSDTESGIASVILPNGSTTNNATGTHQVTVNGTYEFTVTDKAGNTTTETITIDRLNSPHVITMTNDLNSGYLAGKGVINIEGTLTDADNDNAFIKYSINDDYETTLPDTYSPGNNFSFAIDVPSTLTTGNHTLKIWAVDANTGVSSNIIEKTLVIIDNTPHVISITSEFEPTYLEKRGVVTIKGKLEDAENDEALIRYSINNGSTTDVVESFTPVNGTTNYEFSFNLTDDLAPGTHTLKVWAEDANTRTPSNIVTKWFIVRENSRHVIHMTSELDSSYIKNTGVVYIEGTLEDEDNDSAIIKYSINDDYETTLGGDFTPVDGSIDFDFFFKLPSELDIGTYTLKIWAEDLETGTLSNIINKNLVISENAPHVITLTNELSPSYLQGVDTVYINGNLGDIEKNEAIIKYSIDDANETTLDGTFKPTTTAPINFNFEFTVPSDLAPGNHTLKIWAEDKITGVSSNVIKRTLVIRENARHVITMTNELELSYLQGVDTVYVEGTLDDEEKDKAIIKYSINDKYETTLDGIFTPKSSPAIYDFEFKLPSDLGPGTHTLKIWAEDIDSGKSSNILVKNLIVAENTAPTIKVNDLRDEYFEKDTISVTGTVEDKEKDKVTIKYNFDGRFETTLPNEYDTNNGIVDFEFDFTMPDEIWAGTYELNVWGVDKTTGLSSTIVTKNITVTGDDVAPNISVKPENQGQILKETLNLNLSFTDKGNSGFHSYRYAVTETTDYADNWSDWIEKEIDSITVSTTQTSYIQVEAKDNRDNIKYIILGPYNTDKVTPQLDFTLNTTDFTNKDVIIKLSPKDNDGGSGVNHIILPDNSVVTKESVEYTVSKNGTYSFTVIDNVGLSKTVDIKITNIDKEKPKLEITPILPALFTRELNSKEFTVSASDELSGISKIILHDGTEVEGDTTRVTLTKTGEYTFKAIDNAGNITIKTTTLEDNDFNNNNSNTNGDGTNNGSNNNGNTNGDGTNNGSNNNGNTNGDGTNDGSNNNGNTNGGGTNNGSNNNGNTNNNVNTNNNNNSANGNTNNNSNNSNSNTNNSNSNTNNSNSSNKPSTGDINFVYITLIGITSLGLVVLNKKNK